MKELEKVLKALANRRRLAILKYLKARGEATVGDIAHEIKLSFKATSRHLAVLHACDSIEKDQRSSHVFYHITIPSKPAIKHILALL